MTLLRGTPIRGALMESTNNNMRLFVMESKEQLEMFPEIDVAKPARFEWVEENRRRVARALEVSGLPRPEALAVNQDFADPRLSGFTLADEKPLGFRLILFPFPKKAKAALLPVFFWAIPLSVDEIEARCCIYDEVYWDPLTQDTEKS